MQSQLKKAQEKEAKAPAHLKEIIEILLFFESTPDVIMTPSDQDAALGILIVQSLCELSLLGIFHPPQVA